MPVGWDTDEVVLSWRGFAPLDGDTSADVCVVGLGASGLAAVEAAADRGLRVVGVDAGRVAAGAAGRNGGFLLGGPEPPLHDALDRWGSCALDLYRETLAELDRIEALLPADVVRRVGSIRLGGWPNEPDVAEIADLPAHAEALRAHGIAVEDYDGPLGTGIFLPDDAAMNPAARAIGLAELLRNRAQIHEYTPVVKVAAGEVQTEHGTISAGAVVVAVDGRLPLLLPSLTGRVRTARLQMLSTAPVAPGLVPCPVYGRWGYDYVQQDASGRLFIGGGRQHFRADEWTDEAEPTAGVQAHIEAAARTIAGPVEVEHRWAASAGFTDDERPVCVQVADGVVGVGGYSGTGNLVGPVAARAALAYALDGAPPPAWCAS